jgi:hypothetical protein
MKAMAAETYDIAEMKLTQGADDHSHEAQTYATKSKTPTFSVSNFNHHGWVNIKAAIARTGPTARQAAGSPTERAAKIAKSTTATVWRVLTEAGYVKSS